MNKLFEKLVTVQNQLKAPKSQRNDFGKYNYRNAEDILEALKPILAEVKAVNVLTDEIALIGERYYIKATATFIDIESGDRITATAYAREEETKKGMDASQITGSASSYARKYALNGLYGIDDTKDADDTNKHGKEEEQPKQLATPSQIKIIQQLYSEEEIKKMLANPKLNKPLVELTLTEASQMIAARKKE